MGPIKSIRQYPPEACHIFQWIVALIKKYTGNHQCYPQAYEQTPLWYHFQNPMSPCSWVITFTNLGVYVAHLTWQQNTQSPSCPHIQLHNSSVWPTSPCRESKHMMAVREKGGIWRGWEGNVSFLKFIQILQNWPFVFCLISFWLVGIHMRALLEVTLWKFVLQLQAVFGCMCTSVLQSSFNKFGLKSKISTV